MHDILAPHVYPRPVPFCVFFGGFLFLFMFWSKWKRHGTLYLCPIEAVWLIILSDLPASLNWNARYSKFIHPFLFPFLNSVLIHKLYPKALNTLLSKALVQVKLVLIQIQSRIIFLHFIHKNVMPFIKRVSTYSHKYHHQKALIFHDKPSSQ